MTVIAYRDGLLAADSLVTAGHVVTGRIQKLWRFDDGRLLGGAGVAGDMRSFVAWALAGCKGHWECQDKENGFSALVVGAQGEVVMYDAEGRDYLLEAEFIARGAGAELAIGAMAMGARADQAVEVACRYSVWCGGPVQRLYLAGAEFDTQDMRNRGGLLR
jgi:ATP-dependent HslUV protease subunit HslV